MAGAGFAQTPSARSREHAHDADQAAREVAATAAQSVFGCWAEPTEVASAIAFLASDEASFIPVRRSWSTVAHGDSTA